jgi:hypothetical protein
MSNNTIITTGTAGQSEPSRNEPNIMDNAPAMAILQNTVSELRAIGVHCMLAPMSLPQGMTISLHAGSGVESAVAAYVAAEVGGEYAGSAATHAEFTSKLQHALEDANSIR